MELPGSGSLARAFYRAIVPSAVRQAIRRSDASKRSWREEILLLRDGRLRRAVERLDGLRGSQTGRCFVMGTGPSLNDMDLGLLAEEAVWMVNKGYLAFDRISWRPSFYVSIDKLGAEDHGSVFDSLTKDLPGTRFFFPVEHRVAGRLRSTRPNVFWIPTVPVDMADPEARLPDGTITQLPTVGVAVTYTVTAAVIQLAAFLGFDPIYLIGCDMDYQPTSAAVVDVDARSGLQTLRETASGDTNHFDARYHAQGDRWYLPRTDLMVRSYELTAERCRELGVSVYNATVGGRLEVFPRVEFRELFGRR